MEKEKNIIIMVNYNLKDILKMIKEMEKEKNIIFYYWTLLNQIINQNY